MANSTNNNTFTVLIEFAKWYNGQGITRNYVSNLKSVQKDMRILEKLSMERKKGWIRIRGVTIRKESYTTPYKEL